DRILRSVPCRRRSLCRFSTHEVLQSVKHFDAGDFRDPDVELSLLGTRPNTAKRGLVGSFVSTNVDTMKMVDNRGVENECDVARYCSHGRGKILPRRSRSTRISPDVSGRRDPLTLRDDCKATRLMIVRHRLGRVRVPPLALVTYEAFSTLRSGD